jgi:hypothetical protein
MDVVTKDRRMQTVARGSHRGGRDGTRAAIEAQLFPREAAPDRLRAKS